jgi:hypothetical protein
MGKITDTVMAVIVLIVGLYVLTKLGLTAGSIWSMLKGFFSGSNPPTNTTYGSIFGVLGITSNSKLKEKIREKKEWMIHSIRSKQLRGLKR